MGENSPLSLSDSGSLKFGSINAQDENSMLDLPAAIFLGVVCGLLGALFIYVSIALSMLRKQHVNTSLKKVLESVLFAFVTASVFFGVVLLRSNDCRLIDTAEGETYEF